MIMLTRRVPLLTYPAVQSKIEYHVGNRISHDFPGAKSGGKRMKLERITVDPNVCTGKPCIRGLRFPVSRLLGLLASGETKATILKAYPYLEAEDIDEALQYAAFLPEDETVEFTL
jgi:uncharacterized protein (DUF433 family)